MKTECTIFNTYQCVRSADSGLGSVLGLEIGRSSVHSLSRTAAIIKLVNSAGDFAGGDKGTPVL